LWIKLVQNLLGITFQKLNRGHEIIRIIKFNNWWTVGSTIYILSLYFEPD